MASINPTTNLSHGGSAGGTKRDVLRTLSVPQRILLAQAAAGAFVALIWALVDHAELGAAVLGGLVVLLPNSWLALQFQANRPAGREVGQALAKFVLAIGLILLVFVVFKPTAAGFFSALVVCSLTPILAPLFLQPAKLATVPKLPVVEGADFLSSTLPHADSARNGAASNGPFIRAGE